MTTNTLQRIHRFSRLAVIASLTLVLCFGYLTTTPKAQDKKGAATPTTAPTAPDQSLTLTKDELARGNELFTRLREAQSVRDQLLVAMMSTDNEDIALGYWARAVRKHADLQTAEKAFSTWAEAVRKSHNCLDCELNGDTLVRKKP